MVAKGFKGKYFSLQAITATISTIKLHSISAICKNLLLKDRNREKDDESLADDEIIEFLNNSKPCYCNLFFACLAHKVLKLTKIKKVPICRCRKTKSGIAPPFFV